MFEDRKKGTHEGATSTEDPDDRPTAVPPFDPEAFARKTMPPPGADAGLGPGTGTRKTPLGIRPPMDTRSDPEETFAALSFEEEEPPSRRTTVPPMAAPRGYRDDALPPPAPAPAGLLSLANTRVPSDVPPPRRPATPNQGNTARPPAFERHADPGTSNPPARTSGAAGSYPVRSTNVGLGIPAQALTGSAAGISGRYAQTSAPDHRAVRGPDDAPSPRQEMKELVALGDYSGALAVAESLLSHDESDDEARSIAESCQGVLKNMYLAKIGPLDRVPAILVARDELRWLSLDHRAGFVLSLVDGVSTVEMLIDVSGMPELDTLRILADLAQQRILAFR